MNLRTLSASTQNRTRFVGLANHQCGRHHSTSAIALESSEGSCTRPENLRLLCSEGRLKEALHILDLMTEHGIRVHPSSHVCLLQGCVKLEAVAEGKQVHAHIVKTGSMQTIFLWTSVFNMYAQCKSLIDARQVFDSMPQRDLLAWNMMIAAYAKHGYAQETFKLFQLLEEDGVKPDAVTFMSILKACSTLGHLNWGKQIHAHIIKSRVQINMYLGNALIDMYSKCRSIESACEVFEKMTERNVVSWTAMMTGYARHGYFGKALRLYGKMICEGVEPNEVTFVSVLNACAGLGDLEHGKLIYADIMKSGVALNIFMQNALIDMYAKCGSIDNAWQVFNKMPVRDVVSWSAVIAGSAWQGCFEKAFTLFEQMECEGTKPNDVTYVSIFNAYASLENLEEGRRIHSHTMQSGAKLNDLVGTALVDMYSKCGSVEDARQVFNKLPQKDVILWNAMLSGYTNPGDFQESVKLFQKMEQAEVKPNESTFTIILNTCATLAALELGKHIHARIIECGCDTNTFVGSTLVNMYAKCGNIEEARQVFNNFSEPDVVLWTAMISGYAQHGQGNEALLLASQMKGGGVPMNHITFVGVLSACSRAGLVEEGCYYFDCMSQDFDITPITEHYVCMVDLFGRAGCLDEADTFIKKLPCQPDAVVWRALLGACRTFGDVDRAKHIAECIIDLEPEDEGAFVLLSNIYGAAGKYEDNEMVED